MYSQARTYSKTAFFYGYTHGKRGAAQKTAVNYDSFGAPLLDRTSTENGAKPYAFGLNGQMKDDEVNGEGNSYTAEYWQYDPRLGRRWNIDPKPLASISPYAAFSNNPIYMIDIKGDTSYYFNLKGDYLGSGNLDQSGVNAIILQTVHNTMDAKTVTTYSFNDPNDATYLGSLQIGDHALDYINTGNVGWFLKESGLNINTIPIRISLAQDFAVALESRYVDMDFQARYFWTSVGTDGLDITSTKEADATPRYFIFEGDNKLYNIGDAGNWLWGAAMAVLGYSQDYATFGANMNEGCMDCDAKPDQAAIKSGHAIVKQMVNSIKHFEGMSAPGFIDENHTTNRNNDK